MSRRNGGSDWGKFHREIADTVLASDASVFCGNCGEQIQHEDWGLTVQSFAEDLPEGNVWYCRSCVEYTARQFSVG
ncbi:MAG TPA: hypothetical protein VNC41_12115 [Acidimicrobiia bacterium]|nr:hypothetical protein [Acidimicrobiia bacterium]